MNPTPEAQPSEPASPPTFEERFASLEASNINVASNVRDLTVALQMIHELDSQQQDQARQMAKNKQDTDLRLRRTRQSVNLSTIAMAILLPLVSIFVYLILIEHVDTLLAENYAERRDSCFSRNAGSQASVDRERALAQLENDPAVKKIHLDSASDIAKSLVDCDKLFPKQDD